MVFGAPGRSEVFLRSSYEKPRWAVRDEGLKYIYASSDGLEELYDLREDPGETRNLIERQPLRAAFYRQLLFGWILEQRRGGGGSAERAELTPNQLENLRALGYVR
jgi:hypothetical protein